MARGRRCGQLTRYQKACLERYLEEAGKLPDSDEEWIRQDINLANDALGAFSHHDVIEAVRRDKTKHTRNYWRTVDGVTEWVEDRLADRQTTPCGNAAGIHTIEVGVYTCSDETCDCRMDRETAAAVVA